MPVRFYSIYVSDIDTFLLDCLISADGGLVVEAMRKIPSSSLKKLKLSRPVYFVLPSYGVFTKLTDLVAPNEDILPLAADYEARRSVPMPMHVVSTSYALMPYSDGIVRKGIVSAVKREILNKYIELYLEKSNKILGYTYGLVDFYNLLCLYAERNNLRSASNIVLGLFAGDNYVDVVILGENQEEDIFKTIHRSNYVSAVFDVKEMLEVYFARHGGVAGAVALTKGISKCIFLGHSYEARQEIKGILSREFAVTPQPLSIFDLIDNPPEDLKDCGFVMALGQALSISKGKGFLGLVFSESHKEKQTAQVGLATLILNIVLLIGILVSSIAFAMGPWTNIRRGIQKYEAVLGEQRRLAKSIKRNQRRINDISKKIEVRSLFRQKQMMFAKAISIISNLIPDGVRITELNSKLIMAKGVPVLNITFSAVGLSYQDINNFVQLLRNESSFSKVVPVASRLLEGNDKVEVLVSIEV